MRLFVIASLSIEYCFSTGQALTEPDLRASGTIEWQKFCVEINQVRPRASCINASGNRTLGAQTLNTVDHGDQVSQTDVS